MYHNLFDSHVHTDNSLDAQHSAMYMAEHAEQHGLMGLAFTDHAECAGWDAGARTRVIQSVVDAAKTAEAFRHRLSVSAGVEVGLTRDLDTAGRIVDLYPFDVVLGALHQTRAGDELYDMDYAALGDDGLRALMDGYFEDMLHAVRWGRFQVLAHMNFPCRCAAKLDVEIDLAPWAEPIDEILRALVEQGIALEVNAAGLRGPLGQAMPPAWVLRRHRELGGELVTIGSDAHRAGQLGGGIDACMAMLEELGYAYFAFFRGRSPIMLRIV